MRSTALADLEGVVAPDSPPLRHFPFPSGNGCGAADRLGSCAGSSFPSYSLSTSCLGQDELLSGVVGVPRAALPQARSDPNVLLVRLLALHAHLHLRYRELPLLRMTLARMSSAQRPQPLGWRPPSSPALQVTTWATQRALHHRPLALAASARQLSQLLVVAPALPAGLLAALAVS